MTVLTTSEYLDRLIAESLRTNRQIRYDSDLVQALGVTRTAIALYRQGGNMSVVVAVRLAEQLRLHPMETISATMYKQSKADDDKKLWLYYYEQYKS